MTATLVQTEDDIYTRLKTVWDAEPDSMGISLVYDNTYSDAPPDDGTVAWARATVHVSTSKQSAFGTDNGESRWNRPGIVTVQIFIPRGKGMKLARKLAQVVIKAFQGHVTPNGVVFREVEMTRINPLQSEPEGRWRHLNVLCHFEVDEIR